MVRDTSKRTSTDGTRTQGRQDPGQEVTSALRPHKSHERDYINVSYLDSCLYEIHVLNMYTNPKFLEKLNIILGIIV